jgi:hypothetical protein
MSSDCTHISLTFLDIYNIFFKFVNNIVIMSRLKYRFAFAKQKILSALNDFLKSFLMSSGVQYVGSCEYHMYQSASY